MAAVAQFLSSTITRICLFRGQICLGPATGFFLKCDGNWSLVTNWHVLSGRDPRSGQPLSNTGAVPDRCSYHIYKLVGEQLVTFSISQELGDTVQGSATWLEHPIYGQGIDIAVLPLKNQDVGLAKDLLDPSGFDPDFLVDLGAELFVPGYPLGFAAPGVFPVWKRASLASSLEFGEGIDQHCLIDTATREGMSGAPCIALTNWKYYRLNRDTGATDVIRRPLSWTILGVYSGRRNPSDGFEAQIGVVWRFLPMVQVLESGRKASVSLR